LVALRRLGTVEDCAKVIEFLATDLSDYVTGAEIPIDGWAAARIAVHSFEPDCVIEVLED